MKIKLYLPLLLIFVQQGINGMSISNNPLLSVSQAINNNTLTNNNAKAIAALFEKSSISTTSQLPTIYPASTISASSLLSNVIADCTSIGTSSPTTTSITALTNNNIYFTTNEVRVNALGLPINASGTAVFTSVATVDLTNNPIYNGIDRINTGAWVNLWTSGDATEVALYVAYLTSYKANASSDKTALAALYSDLNLDTLIDALIVDINSFIAAEYMPSGASDTAHALLVAAGYSGSAPTLYE